MASKYNGIDQREIKCADQSVNTIEAGISFDTDEGINILRFHFLDFIPGTKELCQDTKSMHLDKQNTLELIERLQEIGGVELAQEMKFELILAEDKLTKYEEFIKEQELEDDFSEFLDAADYS